MLGQGRRIGVRMVSWVLVCLGRRDLSLKMDILKSCLLKLAIQHVPRTRTEFDNNQTSFSTQRPITLLHSRRYFMNHNQQDRFGHSGDDSWRAGRRNQSNINHYNASYRNNFQEGQQPTKRGRYGEPVHGHEQMPQDHPHKIGCHSRY